LSKSQKFADSTKTKNDFKQMITIIIGTNRSKSEANNFGKQYYRELIAKDEQVNYLHLKDINPALYHPEMYDEPIQAELLAIQKQYILPADKFIFIIPEYNGGMPGAIKMFIDALSIYKRDETFSNKKAAIVGVASGRAGNLRGMEHLTGILHYLNTTVLPNRQPYSSIHKLMDKSGNITDTTTLQIIQNHVEQIIKF
jgi:chromate reductase